ncbi:TlpA disulfide reductase family protein [Pedobacter heparinus]|uniref:Alkyl hydroperoxide reductase/ Thiol specific antioxidant/ Mal allergen n=1 Tax=Pedobacter heparinus (strain ATCC 13125 / DSM 2366 / CIP 104194 / JCM 7457 / NBRC 12017 / NCIMB 9290 / NRRL B-14731 / HIM 762-3) TaxID=485917 RepID=C6Y2R7_PEDHD|nr:TlpA disulfide reductase family protein [Pedobacter heparinus]ACU03130.1 alkyl hydroperoxide reductase/ Thiol specific antioxidant/ Mal allergen [Pedobacter heparinus DSM 2366]
MEFKLENMMNSRCIVILVALLFGISTHNKAQTKDEFILRGELRGLPDKTKLYLITQEKDTVAGTISNGEQFSFKGTLLKNGRFHFIRMDTSVSKLFYGEIFIVNGDMTASGVLNQRQLVITGSKGQDDLNYLISKMAFVKIKQIDKQLESMNTQLDNRGKNVDSTQIKIEKNRLLVKREQLFEDCKKMALEWLTDNPASLYAPYFIIQCKGLFGSKAMGKLYDQLSAQAKNSYYGDKLKKEIMSLNLSLLIQEGALINNFSITTPEGNQLLIHDIAAKSKLTLIDCWASWCGPCRQEIPELKKLYNTYNKNGFNIVGISSDNKENDWKKALAEDGTPWIHGIDGKNKTVLHMFDIRAIPAYILIDDEGRLIAFDCPLSNVPLFGGRLRGNDLENKIKNLLNVKGK